MSKAENLEAVTTARKTARISKNASPSTVERRSRKIEEKRRNILEAALALFSQSGFAGVSIDEIARKADVSKTNLLYYFDSKDALYVALLQDILSTWLEPLRAFSADMEPR